MSAVFRSPQARDELVGWCERFLKRIEGPFERIRVRTSLGEGHVLMLGDAARPPLVVLHGSLGSSAHCGGECVPLMRHFRVILPDVPAQSALGPDARPPLDGRSHAAWLVEVLDALGLDRVAILGVSLGGYIAMTTARLVPQRVSALGMLVPAGLVAAPAWASFRDVWWPFVRYQVWRSRGNLRRLMLPQFTGADDLWLDYFEAALRCFRLHLRMPPLATDAELAQISVPTWVVGAELDVHFPGRAMAQRVARLPKGKFELLAGTRHTPPMTPAWREWFAERAGQELSTV